jgi:hypothetical protein
MAERCFFVEFDKAGSEWVITAYLTGDARMIEVATGDKSPHVVTGSYISGAPHELIEQEDKIIGMLTDPTEIAKLRALHLPQLLDRDFFIPRSMSIRQAGKKSNHGLNYGMQYRRFAFENEMDEYDAKKIVYMYSNEAYPGLSDYWEGCKRELQDNNRTLINCFGEKRRFLDEWGPELWMAAYAYKPQSTNVRMVNNAMREVYKDPKLQHWRNASQVHDSLMYQIPWLVNKRGFWKQLAVECTKIANDYMMPRLEYGGREFYVKTDMKIGWNWGADVEGHNGDILRKGMEKVKIVANDVNKTAENLQATWEKINAAKKAA